jgi:hypothetical protein
VVAWRDLGEPARGIGSAIARAVDAAADRDPDAYQQTVDALGALPGGSPGELLGAVLRSLLEEQHPDGLDGDDIREVLTGCYRTAAGWLPPDRLDAHVLLAALASALGVHEPGVTYEEIVAPPGADAAREWLDPVGGRVIGAGSGGAGSGGAGTAGAPGPEGVRVPTAAQYAGHAPLLIADLLGGVRRRLNSHLDAAFAEILRAETMEQP